MSAATGDRPRVLFLCTGNACRSQMAEGWARALHGQALEPCSAGTERHGLNPDAVRVMAEAGVDISRQRSKTLGELQTELRGAALDLVVTVCDRAAGSCPSFAGGTRRVHAGFDDPPALAARETDRERALDHYRRVRDEIRAYVERLPAMLASQTGGAR